MSVNYDLYETPDLAKSGEEQPLHARVVLKGSYTAEEFVEQVTALQHMPHAQVATKSLKSAKPPLQSGTI